jgi:hypothetical protein
MYRLYIKVENKRHYYNKEENAFISNKDRATKFTSLIEINNIIKKYDGVYDELTHFIIEYVYYIICVNEYKLGETWLSLEECQNVCKFLNEGLNKPIFTLMEIIQ